MKKIIGLYFFLMSLFSCPVSEQHFIINIHNPNDFDLLYVVNNIQRNNYYDEYGSGDLRDDDVPVLKANAAKIYENNIYENEEKMIQIIYAMKDPSDDANYTGNIYYKYLAVHANEKLSVYLDFEY